MKLSSKAELQLNIIVSVISQLMNLVINFFSKQAILKALGQDYLGLQTVFANMCDLLTLAFAAAGMVLMFNMYEPLNTDNPEKVKSVYYHFTKLFNRLTMGATFISVCFIALLFIVVHADVPMYLVVFYYMLYALSLLIYNRALNCYYFIVADQKRYITATILSGIDLIALIFEVLVLFRTGNYGIFLGIIVTKNLVEFLLLNLYRKKHYGYIRGRAEEISDEQKKSILIDVKAMIVSKVGGLLLYSTDSMIISAIINTAVSGCYSCYNFVALGIQYCIQAIFEVLLPKAGQLSVNGTKESQFEAYKLTSLVNIGLAAVSVTGLYTMCAEFIMLWMGEEVLLPRGTEFFVALNLYIVLIRCTSGLFRSAVGMFKQISNITLFRGILNIFVSIALGLKFGLFGIIAATAISDLSTVFWFEPKLVLGYYGRSMWFETLYQMVAVVTIAACVIASTYALGFIPAGSWMLFVVRAIAVAITSCVVIATIDAVILGIHKLRNRAA